MLVRPLGTLALLQVFLTATPSPMFVPREGSSSVLVVADAAVVTRSKHLYTRWNHSIKYKVLSLCFWLHFLNSYFLLNFRPKLCNCSEKLCLGVEHYYLKSDLAILELKINTDNPFYLECYS